MGEIAATVSVRRQRGVVVEDRDWGTAPLDLLQSACPWRTFRWYKGQKHYSGTYWSATTRDHVIYESRLELSCLLFAPVLPGLPPLQRRTLAVVLEARLLLRLHPAPSPAGGLLPALRAGSAAASRFRPVCPPTGILRQSADPPRWSDLGGLRN